MPGGQLRRGLYTMKEEEWGELPWLQVSYKETARDEAYNPRGARAHQALSQIINLPSDVA